METLLYQEEWTYEWKRSKAKIMECEAVDGFEDLLPAEYYQNGEFVYVLSEKQLYRAKHKRRLKYMGKEDPIAPPTPSMI